MKTQNRSEKNNIERRFFKSEVRMEGDDKKFFVGEAAVYNSKSVNMGWGDVAIFEFVEPGFFNEALATSDVRCLQDHTSHLILGRRKPDGTGTMELSTDGAFSYKTLHPGTTIANDLEKSMSRGDIDGSSFGFSIKYIEDGDDIDGQRWERQENGDWHSFLVPNGCKRIYDVGPVTFPAYPAASSGVSERHLRSFEAAKKEYEERQKPEFNEGVLKAMREAYELI